MPQLAIPVTLPHKAYTDVLAAPEPLIRKTGCLILVEFYFVLRVGEYTKPETVMQNGKRVSATLTKQLLVGNVEFFHNGMIMPRNSPLDVFHNSLGFGIFANPEKKIKLHEDQATSFPDERFR